MADMYSKLLGLSGEPTPPTPPAKEKPARTPEPSEKQTRVQADQHTSPPAKPQRHREESQPIGHASKVQHSPPQKPKKTPDTSLLSTKEKTKYGTYLTDESIQKISIRAIHTNRDAHQIVQEAVNQYFEHLES